MKIMRKLAFLGLIIFVGSGAQANKNSCFPYKKPDLRQQRYHKSQAAKHLQHMRLPSRSIQLSDNQKMLNVVISISLLNAVMTHIASMATRTTKPFPTDPSLISSTSSPRVLKIAQLIINWATSKAGFEMLVTMYSAARLGCISPHALLIFPLVILAGTLLGYEFDKIRSPLLVKKVITTFLDIAGPTLPFVLESTTIEAIGTGRFFANATELFFYLTAWIYWATNTRTQDAAIRNLANLDSMLWRKTKKLLVFDIGVNGYTVPWLTKKLPVCSLCSTIPVPINAMPRLLASLWNFWFSLLEIKELMKKPETPQLIPTPSVG